MIVRGSRRHARVEDEPDAVLQVAERLAAVALGRPGRRRVPVGRVRDELVVLAAVALRVVRVRRERGATGAPPPPPPLAAAAHEQVRARADGRSGRGRAGAPGAARAAARAARARGRARRRRRHDHGAVVVGLPERGEAGLELRDERVHRGEAILGPLRHRALKRGVEPERDVRAHERDARQAGRSRAARRRRRSCRRGTAASRRGARRARRRGSRRPRARRRGRRSPARARCSRSSPSRCPSGSGPPGRRAERAIPKSVTFTSPFPSSTFCGFTSRWTSPFACAKASARPASIASSSAVRTGSRPCSSTSCFRFLPSTYSKTMNCRPSASPRSITVTMFGCESFAAARASRRKRST